MASLKPLILYGGVMGPNPSKVGMILAELNIPFEAIYIPHTELKGDSYTKVNPNGRLPAIEDPNTGITIWESGAIIEYLISEYDPTHKISFPVRSKEDYLTKQWLFFQVSGQGPYYGQGSVSLPSRSFNRGLIDANYVVVQARPSREDLKCR